MEDYSYLVDPHTACAFKDLDSSEKYLILATAHPAKFPSVYPKASLSIPTSTTLEELNAKKSKKYFVDSDPKAIRAFIEEHLD
jgi:threonine synthase